MSMSEADMEQYAQMLDELSEKDPAAYEQFIQTMREQVQQLATSAGGDVPGDLTPPPDAASMMDMIKNAASRSANQDAFKPQFPGNKVMETGGLTAKQEGIYIDVEPGFVMKTTDLKKKQKVFVNICHASAIQTFSQRKQLDDKGVEQEGIHVPLSLGAPHEVEDKSGNKSIAFDVAVNTQVVDDCKADKTGAFRNFVCELAIEYIDQKYKIQLDPRYKLPKLTYRGPLPPPKHYIRKTQTPIIEEVASSNPGGSSSKKASTKPDRKKVKPQTECTATYEFFELTRSSIGNEREKCSRVAAVDAKGTALSKEMLDRAGTHLAVRVRFTGEVTDAEDVEIELRAEHVSLRVHGHHDLSVYLPFPVDTPYAEVTLDRAENHLEVIAPIDKTWNESDPDAGSAQWLLIQALRGGDQDEGGGDIQANVQDTPTAIEPASLVEMFHLAAPPTAMPTMNDHATTRWDPVDEDDELPEDRFHRKDMMSMHILEQRKKERQLKAQEADAKRAVKRAENEEKRRKAQEAGKSWQEMYPSEPETTYIDMDDLIKEQKEKHTQQTMADDASTPCVATQTAALAAAAWSQEKRASGLNLQSALAFDLLD